MQVRQLDLPSRRVRLAVVWYADASEQVGAADTARRAGSPAGLLLLGLYSPFLVELELDVAVFYYRTNRWCSVS